jgi:4-amino-4-deoxy-L-arabinose transferase-like glycosyltransferase
VLALLLVVARLRPSLRVARSPALALAFGIPALLAAPALWSALTVTHGDNTTLPSAGPSASGFPGGPAVRGGTDSGRGGTVDEGLIAYLEANRGEADYLVAAPSAITAAPIILATGEPVMAMGGFSGNDPILTAEELARLVAGGTVRFVLVGGGPGGSGPVMNWAMQNCMLVPAEQLGGSSSRLYDCAVAQT